MHRIEQPAAEAIVAGRHDGNVDIAAFEAARQAGAAVLDEMNLDAGVTLAVARQKARQQGFDHLRGGAEPEHADVSALEGARPLAERRRVGQQSAAAHQQVLALPRQPHAASDARKQPQAQFILEHLDLPRRRRLRQIEPRGRTRHTGIVGGRHEGAQEPQVHVSYSDLSSIIRS